MILSQTHITLMKPHPIFDDYVITENGDVINRRTNRKLKTQTNKKGYMNVGLMKDKKQYYKRINRLVLETYRPIENAHLYHAHHNNEIKTDNRLENLEWELIADHIREHKKGQVLSEEHKRKLLEANRGKVVSEETRRKLSEANKGKVLSEETRRKIGEANKGLKKSEETKRKISDSCKGRMLSEETRRKMSETKKGHLVTKETKRKMSEARIGKPNQCLVGKVWWNNGVKSIRRKEWPGEGWIRGRK